MDDPEQNQGFLNDDSKVVFLKPPSTRLAVLSVVFALFCWPVWHWAGGPLGLVYCLFSVSWAFWAQWRADLYPKSYGGRPMALAALFLSGLMGYFSLSSVLHPLLLKRAFQLSDQMSSYRETDGRWTLSYPERWSHEEIRNDLFVSHAFKPAKESPALFFTVMSKPAGGETQVGQVAQHFLESMNTADNNFQLYENREESLQGRPAVRIVYGIQTGRIPLKNEVLLVLETDRLYLLTIGGAPRWFDRNRTYLRKLLYSFQLQNQ
ncbi:MAG TPA: PsbP-related protein [Elusimicrobiota bacterium]|nr:PsbP-related protein [Elusimicrobiota bacterium]